MGLKRKRNLNVVFKATEGSEVNQSAASEYPSFTGSPGAQTIPAAFPWLLLPVQGEGVMAHGSFLHEHTTPLEQHSAPPVGMEIMEHCVLPLCLPCRREELLGIIFEWKVWGNPSVNYSMSNDNDLRRTQ